MTYIHLKWLALSLVSLTVCAFSGQVRSDEVVTSDDGREIRLNADGSWVQLDRDRYATNASGERVRLKADGSWSIVGAGQTPSGVSPPVAATGDSSLYLAKVEILKRKIKRAKSVHAETRTIYHLQVRNDSAQAIELRGDLESSLKAGSSSGADYPITSVTASDTRVVPGQNSTLLVTAEGSPQWFGTKSMNLEVAARALGNASTRVLIKNMDDVERREVDSFE